jgi:hypothetical protein
MQMILRCYLRIATGLRRFTLFSKAPTSDNLKLGSNPFVASPDATALISSRIAFHFSPRNRVTDDQLNRYKKSAILHGFEGDVAVGGAYAYSNCLSTFLQFL